VQTANVEILNFLNLHLVFSPFEALFFCMPVGCRANLLYQQVKRERCNFYFVKFVAA
jgi:hypothetical protein